MQSFIASSLFFSCALSLSLPIDSDGSSQYNKRNFDQDATSYTGGRVCESSSQVFTENDIQQTALRACNLLRQQKILDACQECSEIRPKFPQMFNGIIAEDMGHKLHQDKHQKTHSHPGSSHIQVISIDHHKESDHEPLQQFHHLNFEDHETSKHKSNEYTRPEHEKSAHDSTIHFKTEHGNHGHAESGFHVPHHQYDSKKIVLQFPIHSGNQIHDSARMVEPSTSILMTPTCVVLNIVERKDGGHYQQCKERPLSSLMPIESHHKSSHRMKTCIQERC